MAKILIIRGGALGDFILTLPALEMIRKSFPEAHIEVLGYPNVTPLAEFAGLADATRSMEYGPLSLFFAPGSTLPDELIEYFSSFSVVISYLYDPDGYFETNVRKAGVDTYLRGPYQMDESGPLFESAAKQLAAPLEQLALFPDKSYVDFSHLGPPDSQNDASPVVAIHPGSGSPKKNWSFESWIEVASQLKAAVSDVSFLFISGEAEDQTIGEFLQLASSAGLTHRHLAHPKLGELAAELMGVSAFLGHDTGISHLAGACGVPALVLFGQTNPAIWAPQNPQVEVVQAPQGNLSRLEPKTIADSAIRLFHTLR